ncbi:MAG: hypothetical protein ABIK83_15175 [Candidatus Zixiibacteriota bacterium]
MNRYLISITVALILFMTSSVVGELSQLSYETVSEMVRQECRMNPDTLVVGEANGKPAIAASFTRVFPNPLEKLVVLREFAGLLQVIYEIEEPGRYLVELEFVIINERSYLYHAYHSHGNAAGGVTFTVVDLQDFAQYDIDVGGAFGDYSHMAPISPELRSRPDVLAFLESRVATSELVYHPTPDDFNLDLPRNAFKRWRSENEGIEDTLRSSNHCRAGLNLYWYDAALQDLHGGSGRLACAENDRFIVTSLFKGGVVCADKKIGKACVLLSPFLGFDSVRFVTSDEVAMWNEYADIEYVVNIDKSTVTKAERSASGRRTDSYPLDNSMTRRRSVPDQVDIGAKEIQATITGTDNGYSWRRASESAKTDLCRNIARMLSKNDWKYYYDVLETFYDSDESGILSQQISFIVGLASAIPSEETQSSSLSEAQSDGTISYRDMQVYDYLQEWWDYYEIRDGGYYPEIHDDLVLSQASDKFGMSVETILGIFFRVEKIKKGL